MTRIEHRIYTNHKSMTPNAIARSIPMLTKDVRAIMEKEGWEVFEEPPIIEPAYSDLFDWAVAKKQDFILQNER